ncbi:cyclase family protein [Roseovarius salis]|uniref:cyclase family protein n=1 Tax=Roseovarius salis TaxID=3376063 RepID=UPI0037CB4EDC
MVGVRLVLCLALLIAAPAARAQEWREAGHGPEDASGASNYMTEGAAIDAANLIRRGRVVEIGRDYRPDMPLRDEQRFELTRSVSAGQGAIRVESRVTAALGAGTRLDGLGHVGHAGPAETGGRFYNGHATADVTAAEGVLGIEHVKPFFTRGILIDMVTVRGRPMEAGEEITVEDIETALDWFGLAPPGKGDVVIFHTGWGRHWIADNDTYLSGAPGIGMAAAEWLAARKVALIGADTWAVEVQSVAEANAPPALPVHLELIAGHGIFLHENLETERLIDAEVAEFAFVFAPVPFRGATRSPGAPLAVY